MRTTLTLDDDVAIRLTRLQQQSGRTFKDLVNTALRTGLDQFEAPPSTARSPYHLQPVALGPRLPDLDNIADILAVAEGEGYR
jgi:hypothetical protein